MSSDGFESDHDGQSIALPQDGVAPSKPRYHGKSLVIISSGKCELRSAYGLDSGLGKAYYHPVRRRLGLPVEESGGKSTKIHLAHGLAVCSWRLCYDLGEISPASDDMMSVVSAVMMNHSGAKAVLLYEFRGAIAFDPPIYLWPNEGFTLQMSTRAFTVGVHHKLQQRMFSGEPFTALVRRLVSAHGLSDSQLRHHETKSSIAELIVREAGLIDVRAL